LLSGVSVGARIVVAIMCAKAVLNDKTSLRDLYLLPVRDLLAPVVWALSFAGNRIWWRGDLFYLREGRLARVPREAGS
jgi:ceramide glucosyltransferase